MKVKEKLAIEYHAEFLKKRLHSFEDHYKTNEAYIAGFEKARELILKHCEGENGATFTGEVYSFYGEVQNIGEEDA